MPLVLNDRVLETSTSTGTGTFTLAGTTSGFQTFAAGVGANNTTYYTIVNTNASEWEVGLGTLDATGAILTRTTVYKSSNSNNAVVFTTGTKNVFCTYPSSRSVNYDASNNISITNATIANTGSMTFSGSALRFQGDFSNATFNSRLAFQTSTSNATTGIYAVPNGSSTAASWQATNTADPTNTSKILIATNGSTDVQLVSGINGSGSYLPMSFYNNGSQQMQLSTTGNFAIGTSLTPSVSSKLLVNGVIESNSGGVKYPNGLTQSVAYTPTNVVVNIGTTPLSSFNYTFPDANVTTTSRIIITPSAVISGTPIALGTITSGSAYTNGTYYNVPLTGGTGTGAVASQVTVSVGAITAVSLPSAVGALVNGTITGGSTYPDGTYLNVPLTGGAGIGAVATSITVSGNTVTSVVLPTTGVGSGFANGNTLTASNAFLGGAGSGFVYTVTAVGSFGTNYANRDSLSVSAASVGGTGSGFSVLVALVSSGGDELEMDGIKASAYCATNGLVTVYFDASPGYIAGGRTFAYTLG